MKEKKGARQIDVVPGPSGWKLRISSQANDGTIWLFVPGMWAVNSHNTFGVWPRYIASQPNTASATIVLRGRDNYCDVERHVAGWNNYSTLGDYVDDMRDAFVYLAKRFDRIIMCGHSMGGLLVHLTTQSLPEEVRGKLAGVVTICESTSIVPRMAWNAFTSRSLIEILAGEPFQPHPKDVEKYVLRAGWDQKTNPVFGYESGVAARQLLSRRFKLDFRSPARPRVPHLVVGSTSDPIVPCAATAKTYHKMVRAGLDAHYLTVAPGGHMIMFCNDAEQLIARIFATITHYIAQSQRCATIIQFKTNQEFAA